jgi:hypothetical protein
MPAKPVQVYREGAQGGSTGREHTEGAQGGSRGRGLPVHDLEAQQADQVLDIGTQEAAPLDLYLITRALPPCKVFHCASALVYLGYREELCRLRQAASIARPQCPGYRGLQEGFAMENVPLSAVLYTHLDCPYSRPPCRGC